MDLLTREYACCVLEGNRELLNIAVRSCRNAIHCLKLHVVALPALSSEVNSSSTMTKSILKFSLVTGFLTYTLHFLRALTDDLFHNWRFTISAPTSKFFKVAYYSFIRVQEVCSINVQIYYFFCSNILITNKNPYMRPLLLQITVWEVKGARNGKNVHD